MSGPYDAFLSRCVSDCVNARNAQVRTHRHSDGVYVCFCGDSRYDVDVPCECEQCRDKFTPEGTER